MRVWAGVYTEMPMTPSQSEDKITKVLNAWISLRKEKSFAGVTFEQFTAKVKPSLDAREVITKTKQIIKAAAVERDKADALSRRVVQRVVAAVVADETEGDNGELYKEMGYVRRSERASGPRRKTDTPVAKTGGTS